MSKPNPTRHAPHEIDDYLAEQAPEFRATLEQLRATIKAVAPDCTERVDYKFPIFRLKSDFVAMSAAKRHCALHTISYDIPAALKDQLKAAGIRTSGATFHLKPGVDLPVPLLKKALRMRLAEMEADNKHG